MAALGNRGGQAAARAGAGDSDPVGVDSQLVRNRQLDTRRAEDHPATVDPQHRGTRQLAIGRRRDQDPQGRVTDLTLGDCDATPRRHSQG